MHASRSESGICQHNNLLLVTRMVIDGVEKQKTTVVQTVIVYNHSTKDWVTPKALELPKVLWSHHLVVFEENAHVFSGALVHPCKSENGEAQFNHQGWRADGVMSKRLSNSLPSM